MRRYLIFATLLFSAVFFIQGILPAKAGFIPERILSKIKANAEERYPENSILKENTVSIQEKAYFMVKEFKEDRLPAQELNMIKLNVERKYPYDFVRQLANINKRVRAYLMKK